LLGGMENIKYHTFALSRYTYTVLSTLKYANGAPIVRIYSDSDFSSPDVQGPIINFNVLDENGDVIGYSQVDKIASLYNIHIRTGCFCNTGACQQHLRLSNEDVKRNLQAGHVCGDDIDIIDGRPTGSMRISFGYMSTFEDAQTFLKFIIATRLSESDFTFPSQTTTRETITQSVKSPIQNDHSANNNAKKFSLKTIVSDMGHWNNSSAALQTPETTRAVVSESAIPVYRSGSKPITVTNIYLYPIKSCSAFELASSLGSMGKGRRTIPAVSADPPSGSGNSPENFPSGGTHSPVQLLRYQVSEWPVGNQGLLYDRSWMVVNQNGICISQKQEPRLCLVHPLIDLEQRIMVIKAEGMDPISVPLEENTGREIQIGQSKVCAHRVQTYDCGERIAEWFSELLGRQCHLIRQSSDFKRNANQKHEKGQATTVSLSLVNEAQYLLINTASILQLKEKITERLEEPLQTEELIQRFRANIVISATVSFEEEEWVEISIGALRFQSWINYANGRSSSVHVVASSLKRYSSAAAPLHHYTCRQVLTVILEEPLQTGELIHRFRANIVISATVSFEEEEWVEISIGALRFQRWINYANGRSSSVHVVASSLKRYSSAAAPLHHYTCRQVLTVM
ncbi:Molybdenum cofactor sulfurase, partial [Chelonia mydas]